MHFGRYLITGVLTVMPLWVSYLVFGLVTRMFEDAVTGEKLAAVFVPTAPNPSSGYLEIVPVGRLISTDWTFDQAMNFCVTMGAVAPDRVHFAHSASSD